MKINVTINGRKRSLDVNPGDRAMDVLRQNGFLSMRNGCNGQGSCGNCAILLDGKVVNSCLLLAPQIDGRCVITVESLSHGRNLHPIQAALIDAGVVQCGYCIPAMVLAIENLLAKNSNPTKNDVKEAMSGILCRCTGYEQVYNAVTLASQRMKNAISKEKEEELIAPAYANDLRVVGKPKSKVDGAMLSKGEAAYVEDMVKPGSLYVKTLWSPYAHAWIKDIDTSEAEKTPGVHYVLTYKNAPSRFYSSAGQGFPEPSPYDRQLMNRKVRFVGDRVAAVAAETLEIAEEAVKKIKVDYEVLEPVLSIEDAARSNAPVIHHRDVSLDPLHIGAEPAKNIAAHNSGGIGDVRKGFEEADVVIERTYKSKMVQCTPLEPHVCYTYMDNNRLIVRASTQVPWHLRRVLASILGIGENKIRVVKEKLGGGFGAKQDIVTEDVAAWITWQTGKPVFWRYDREEEFVSSRTRHPMDITIKMGAKKDGTITAMDMNVLANTGAYGVHSLTVPMNACSKSLAIFKCNNVHYSVTSYYTNLPIAGAYQGYGAPQGTYAVQTTAAELAEQLEMDFYDFLEKNRVAKGYHLEILKCLGEGQEGIAQTISSCGLGEGLKKGYEMIQWNVKAQSAKADMKIGKGVAIIQQGTGLPGIDSANAEIQMMGDGTFMVLMGGTDLGTGLETVAVKFTAECLHTNMEDISVIAADTDVTPFDKGAYASSGTYFSGGAVLKAAEKMKEKILDVASEILKEDRSKLQLSHRMRVVSSSGKEVTYAKIAAFTQGGRGRGQLIATGTFTTHEAPIPYGTHFAQVSVNTRTGVVSVDKYYAFHDCGTPVNPELALGQIYGGILKSIGHSMYEEMLFDDKGKCLNPNFLDYKVPMIKDVPPVFHVEILPVADSLGPYGTKSCSEVSVNGAAPALAVAIHDAIGIWIRDWPFTPEKILRALGKI